MKYKKVFSWRDDYMNSSTPTTYPSLLLIRPCYEKRNAMKMSLQTPKNHSNPAQQQPHQQHKRKCRQHTTTTRKTTTTSTTTATTCCSYNHTCPQTRPLTRLLALAVLLTICSPAQLIEALQPSLSGLDNYSGDNRKPAFINCAGYAPSVKEEQPENTYVFTVHAVDPDPNQEIRYSLVQSAFDRPKFVIHSQSGVIMTSHTFDRDEPIHEKFVFVTVQATDNGLPPLDDVCTFNVTIEDINDNPPVFNKAVYDEKMPENTMVSTGAGTGTETGTGYIVGYASQRYV